MSFDIIRATSEHAIDVGYVHAISWHAAYLGMIGEDYLNDHFTPQVRSEIFKRVIPLAEQEFYIGYKDGQRAGIIVVGKARDKDEGEDTGEVSAIYLLPEFLSKGYGKKLMDFGLQRLKDLGFGKAVIWVLKDNERARTFYEKYGFMPDGLQRTIIIDGPHEEVRYSLDISRYV